MGPMHAGGAEHQFSEGQGEEGGDFLPRPVGSRDIMQGTGGSVHGPILGAIGGR